MVKKEFLCDEKTTKSSRACEGSILLKYYRENTVDWQENLDANFTLTDNQRSWLSEPHSLTKRLQAFTQEEIQLQLIQACFDDAIDEEYQALTISHETRVWVREIYWKYREKIWMYARAIIPESTLSVGTPLNTISEKPLGSFLFQDPNLLRHPFEYAKLSNTHFYFQKIVSCVVENENFLLARRSIFIYYQKPLLLTEVFLPDFFEGVEGLLRTVP
jgi:chorismate--pyruvate lyase